MFVQSDNDAIAMQDNYKVFTVIFWSVGERKWQNSDHYWDWMVGVRIHYIIVSIFSFETSIKEKSTLPQTPGFFKN